MYDSIPFDIGLAEKKIASLAPKIIIYSPEGMGKTTLAMNAPNPFFIMTENGADDYEINALRNKEGAPIICRDQTINGQNYYGFDMVMSQLDSLLKQDHDYKTIVIDGLSRLQDLIHSRVIANHPYDDRGNVVNSIGDYNYGKGTIFAFDHWKAFAEKLNELHKQKNVAIIMLAHSISATHNDPQRGEYKRYKINIAESEKTTPAEMLKQECNAVFFINTKVTLHEKQKAFAKKDEKTVSHVGGGEQPFLYTKRTAAFDAKNRYDMPTDIMLLNPFEWNFWSEVAANYIPWIKENM